MSTGNTSNNTPTLSCVDSRPSIPGCQVEIGVYCCVDEQGENDTFSCDVCAVWYNSCDFKSLLENLSNMNFGYQEARNSAFSDLKNLPHASPYNRKKRFPDHIQFTKVSGEMLNHLKAVRSSLSYRSAVDRWSEKYPNLKIPDSVLIDDIKKGDQAQISYREGLTALKRGLNNCNNTYNRTKFEKEYKVAWINGDPECIREVRDVSFLRPRSCCTFRDLRERASLVDLDILINTNDPYNYELTLVPERRFSNLLSINTNSPLPSTGFYIYARTKGQAKREVFRVEYDQNCAITFIKVNDYVAHPDYVQVIPPRAISFVEEEEEDEEN